MPSELKLTIPASPNTVQVSIIDTATTIRCPADIFLAPRVDGLERLTANAFSFLIENPRAGRKVVFDLGVRRDWENYAQPLSDHLKRGRFDIEVKKNVAEILTENGVKLEDIESIIWSHSHFDHIGDPSTFPGSTSLVVGPGIPAAKLPPYPENPSGELLESDFRGRQLVEITPDRFTTRIGGFGAHDFFGDGSFYLLDVPGHAVGHMCGLARTTATPDTFILMAADTYHHGGQFRPSPYQPLPEEIVPNPYDDHDDHQTTPSCPCRIFERIHPDPAKYRTEPFYRIRVNEDRTSVAYDVEAATRSISHLQEFDAAENVFVVCAHDASLLGVVDVFPARANGWKDAGWKERGKWRFLRDWDVGPADERRA